MKVTPPHGKYFLFKSTRWKKNLEIRNMKLFQNTWLSANSAVVDFPGLY